MMLDECARPYMGISGDAMGYSLSCNRIKLGREIKRDREGLVKLSKSLSEALKRNFALDDSPLPSNEFDMGEEYFVNSLQGLLLAKAIEGQWLKRDDSGIACRCADGLRELGIDSLESLAEVLSKAEDREEFDKYALCLRDFFKDWNEFAWRCYTLGVLPYPPAIGEAMYGPLAMKF